MPDDQGWIAPLWAAYDRLALQALGSVRPEAKSDGTTITELDRAASRMVEQALRERFPADGIISEENALPHQPEAPRIWVIDPLDGTASFARSFPTWGLGIGLLENGEPVEGYLDFPVLKETLAFAGGRFFHNRQPFNPPGGEVLPDTRNALIGSHSFGDLHLERLGHLKLRNFGSHLYHLAAVALGRSEAMLAGYCWLWDLVPALPFTRARGCIERYADGSRFVLGDLLRHDPPSYRLNQPIIVGGPETVAEIIEKLKG